MRKSARQFKIRIKDTFLAVLVAVGFNVIFFLKGSGNHDSAYSWFLKWRPWTNKQDRTTLTNMLSLILGGRTDTFQASLVAFMITMRKVETSNTHSSINQLFQLGNIPTRRAHCTNDFGLSRFQIGFGQNLGESNVRAAKLGSSCLWCRHDDSFGVFLVTESV